jgi:hypothetical protein
VLKEEKVAGGNTRLHSAELHTLYWSRNIIRAMKSKKVGRTTLVERMGEEKNAYRILIAKPEERRARRLEFPNIFSVRPLAVARSQENWDS